MIEGWFTMINLQEINDFLSPSAKIFQECIECLEK